MAMVNGYFEIIQTDWNNVYIGSSDTIGKYYMAQFVRKTRLERKSEDQITKKTITLGLITVLFLVFLVLLGIPFLVRFAVFLGDMKNKNAPIVVDTSLPPLAPRLFIPYDATNSAQISISGTAEAKTSIELQKNETLLTKGNVSDTGDFSFEAIVLDKGENRFSAVAISEKGVRSVVSKEVTITYDDKPPALTLQAPNADSISVDTADYDVSGTTDKGVSVTVNGHIAMVDNDGKFKQKVQLSSGKNEIEVLATSAAGNQTKKTVTITYDN